MHPSVVDIALPEAASSVGLAATLESLGGQRYPAFGVVIARPPDDEAGATIASLTAILEARGHVVRVKDFRRLASAGRRRQALLDGVAATYLLVVDDGLVLEPDLLGRLVAAIRTTGCGFVGSSPIDLAEMDQHRPADEAIEFWDGPVRPEEVAVGSRSWARRRLHRGASLEHVRERLPRTRDRLYRIADIHGCVLYDVGLLRAVGGFAAIPRRGGQGPISRETAAQLRLLGRVGGAGLFPSGAYRPVATALPGRYPSALRAATDERDLRSAAQAGSRWSRPGQARSRDGAEHGGRASGPP